MIPSNPILLKPTALAFSPTATGPVSGLYQTNPWVPASSQNTGAPGSTATVLNTLGVPVPASPQGQDPAALAASIQTSLAKLDTINPDLANQMREKYLGIPQEDSGGLFGVLKDIGSSIFHGFGEVLDILGRTAHIVPAMLVHDKDPFYTDMAQALSGQDKSTWNDVFKGWGWDGGGLSGAARGVFGFVGDVATDPLTYAFGAGSLLNTSERAAYAAKAGFEATLAARGAELGLQDGAKLADVTNMVWNSMKGEGDNLRMLLRGASPEQQLQVLAGRAGVEVGNTSKALLGDAWAAAGRNYERVYGRTFKTFVRSGATDTLPSGFVLPAADSQSILEGYIKAGIGVSPRSQAAVVAQAKAAAGALGGLRFTPFIPWTSLRYYSPTLPFTMGTLSKPFMTVARFGAGKSAIARAEILIRDLGPTAVDSLSLLHEGGLKALRESADPVSRNLYELLAEGGVVRSAFYRASERTGMLTAAFTPGGKQFRAGLGLYMTESYIKAARATVSNIIKNDLYDTVKVGTSAARGEFGAGQQKLYAAYEQVLHISNRARLDTASVEDRVNISKFLDYFGGLQNEAPITSADVTSGALDTWFWKRADVVSRLAEASGTEEGDRAVRDALEAQLADMKDVLAKYPEGSAERDVLNMHSAVLSRANDIVSAYGIHSRNLGYSDLGTQRVIRPADKVLAEADTVPGVKGQTWYVKMKGAEGATADDVVGNEYGVAGILASNKPSEGAVEVALNVRSPYLVGAGGSSPEAQIVTNILTDEPVVAAARQEAELGMKNTVRQMLAEGHDILPGTIYSPENWDKTLAETTTDLLKQSGGLEHDSILFRDAGGDHLVLYGTKQVKPQDMVWAISPDAAAIGKTHGYYPRTLTRQVREFLGGVYGDARRITRTTPEMEARLVRASTDKSLTEADAAMRAELAKVMQEQGQPAAVIEKLFAKDQNGQYLMPVLEMDPLRAHEHYVDRVGEAVWGTLMGTMGERMNALGKLVPGQFGRTVNIELARAAVDTSAYSQVKRAGKQVEKAVQKLIVKEKVYLDAQITDNGHASERVAELLRRWELGDYSVDLTSIPELNPHTQRLLAASDNLSAAAGKERARLGAERDLWNQRAEDTKVVENLVNVHQYDEVNALIDKHTTAMFMTGEGNEMVPFEIRATNPRTWQRMDLELSRQRAKGTARDLGDGVWSTDTSDGLARTYMAVDDNGKVIASRDTVINSGAATAMTMPEYQRRGLAFKLLKAHWQDQGVANLEDIKRVIGENTYTKDGAALNKTAASRYMREVLQQPDATGLSDMMNAGQLGIFADGTVMTRDGIMRTAGKGGAHRVFSRQEVDQALQRATARLEELDRVIANPYTAGRSETSGIVSHMTVAEEAAAQANFAAQLAAKTGEKPTVVTHAVTMESFDVAQARQELAAVQKAARRTSLEVSAEQVANARQQLGLAVKREAKNQSEAVAKEAARRVRLGRDLQEAMGSLNDMVDTYDNAQAKLRPAIESAAPLGGHSFMSQVSIPGLQGTWWHPYIAQELEAQLHGRPITAFRNSWREFVLNPWKKWATYRNPGFHVRNSMGAWFNNFLGGVTTQDYHFSFRIMSARDGGKWADRLVSPEEFRSLGLDNIPGLRELSGNLTYGDAANMLTDTGITRGSSAAVELVQGGYQEHQRLTAQAARAPRWADQHLRRMSSTVEDYFRVAAWSRGMQSSPGDLYGARAFVMMRHGDYGDLTDTENFIRDIVPFYKWMRTNVPYQIRMLATNPGYMTGVMKLQKSIFDVAGLDAAAYQRAMPDWMKGSISVPIPSKHGYSTPVDMIGFDLPFMDLYKGAREYASSFLPGVLPILESMVTKQVTFSGKALTGEMVPLGGMFQLPGVKQVIAALPFAQMGPDGQVFVPDTMENVLTGIPIYGRFRNWLTGDPSRVEKRWGALTSFFAGIPIRPVDLTNEESLFYYDVLQPTLQSYQSMGVVFPTKDQLVEAGRYFQTPLDMNSLYPTGVVGQAA